jgi:platelet-activating factor acetylhydrolase
VVKDGKIAKDFTGGAAKQLIPIVYVHGLSCNGVAQSGSCRDLASHGYMVFSMDHFDGSAYISKRENGETRFFSAVEPWNERSLLFKKLTQREEECSFLIDEICTSEKLLQEKCNFESEVSIDLNKLILGGHSFGGLTSIYVARKEKRVKAVFGFDPFLYPIAEELVKEEIKVDQP